MLGDRRRVVIEHVRPTRRQRRVSRKSHPRAAVASDRSRLPRRTRPAPHMGLALARRGVLVPDAPPKGLVEVADGGGASGLVRSMDHAARARRLELRRGRTPGRLGWMGARPARSASRPGSTSALDLADGAAMADERSMLPGISKADRRAHGDPRDASWSRRPRSRRGSQLATREATMALMRRTADLRHASDRRARYKLWVDREEAGYSAWYEMFPRSEGAVPPKSGTLQHRRAPAARHRRRWVSTSSTCLRSIRSAPRTARVRTT